MAKEKTDSPYVRLNKGTIGVSDNILPKLDLLFVSIILFVNISFAQTSIPAGNVSGIWTLSGSPYLVQGPIMIPNGLTLSIDPGVTVDFQGSYKLYVQGRLLAVGTPVDSISFTTSDTSVGWLGIRFDNTPNTNDTSDLEYCKILYGKLTGSGNDANGGGLYFLNFSKANISHCRISNNRASNGTGGGLHVENSNPKIFNNEISRNIGNDGGGGISCKNCSPLILGNDILSNSATIGAGIYCTDYVYSSISSNIIQYNIANGSGGGIATRSYSEPMISDNLISNNYAAFSGGGISADMSNPLITNNIINNNAVNSSGGGIDYNNCNPIISDNRIAYNTAQYGGGIHGTYGAPPISYNFISNNFASSNGGGIYFTQTAPSVSNCIISNNMANDGAGIYFFSDGYTASIHYNTEFINCTIVNNSAVNGGGAYCSFDSDPKFTNTILWGNTCSTSGQQVFLNDEPSDPKFYFCNIQGGAASFGLNGNFFTGVYQNVIDTNPLFVSPTPGADISYNGLVADWSLQNGSPCIDAGDPAGSYPLFDFGGNDRIINGFIDIGAYENQAQVGINNMNAELTFLIYPNPVKNIIIIDCKQTSEIEISDVEGKVINNLTNAYSLVSMDISQFKSGIYIIKVRSEKQFALEKIIKL